MVPIRAIAESFGAKVDWDDILKIVTITYDDIEVYFSIRHDENTLNINDLKTKQRKSVPIDSIPVIRNNRTFVPYRVISEAFGYKVYWDANEYKVTIDTKDKQPVFFMNPALSDTYYECIANMNTDFENLIPLLKYPNITVKLTDKEREYYLSMASSHVEAFIGDVDYTKECDPYIPTAPFAGIMRAVHNDAVENSIIREVKFISDPSKVEVLQDATIFALTPTDVIVTGRLEFIYHEASDEYLDRFEGKLKKGAWYSTKIAVKFLMERGSMEIEKVILDNTFEEIT